MKKIFYLTLCWWTFCLGIISCCEDRETVDERTNAAKLGFLPTNTAEENVAALQKGLDSFRNIYVDKPGIYDLDETVYLSSNTRLVFGKGVYIRKQPGKDGRGAKYVFINRGAYNNTDDENIEITGLNLICNGLDTNGGSLQALQGQISFFHIRNLTIKDFTCTDLLAMRFCIQIAEFKNLLIDNVHIEGNKDGIHLGVGNNFVIRNGRFSTLDDPIALNAHDYDISNPTVGWIENGLIEDCYDLPHPSNGYWFCRILAGSWVDWYSGMELQKSDIVVSSGRLYRVIAPADGKKYISYTAPTHTSGYQVIDGINWWMMQEGAIYNAGVKNIHFKNIFLQRERMTAFQFHFDNDNYSRSYYPNSNAPVQNNFTFENIYTENRLGRMITAITPVNDIKFIHSEWKSGNIGLTASVSCNYPPAKILLDGIYFNPSSPSNLGITDTENNRTLLVEIKNSSTYNKDYKLALHGNVIITSSDIPTYYINP